MIQVNLITSQPSNHLRSHGIHTSHRATIRSVSVKITCVPAHLANSTGRTPKGATEIFTVWVTAITLLCRDLIFLAQLHPETTYQQKQKKREYWWDGVASRQSRSDKVLIRLFIVFSCHGICLHHAYTRLSIHGDSKRGNTSEEEERSQHGARRARFCGFEAYCHLIAS